GILSKGIHVHSSFPTVFPVESQNIPRKNVSILAKFVAILYDKSSWEKGVYFMKKRMMACLLSILLAFSWSALAEAPEATDAPAPAENAIFVEAGYRHSFAL